MENLTIDVAHLIYGVLKKDEILGKECTGIFTHVPVGTQPPYLIYSLDAFKLLSCLLKGSGEELFNRAKMLLSISCATDGNSLQQVLRMIQRVMEVFEGSFLCGASVDCQRHFTSFYRSYPQKLSIDKKGDLQFSTLIFEVFIRF